MTRKRCVSEGVTVAALMVALLVALAYRNENARLRATLFERRVSSTRADVQDRLIGRKLDVASLGLHRMLAGADSSLPMMLWIIDLENCVGCFDDVGEWARLERVARHGFSLLLVGNMTREVEARLRGLQRTRVLRIQRDVVQRAIGPVLPNTKLLIDSEDIVLLVDSRATGQDCGWSFEGLVAALNGSEPATAIRSETP